MYLVTSTPRALTIVERSTHMSHALAKSAKECVTMGDARDEAEARVKAGDTEVRLWTLSNCVSYEPRIVWKDKLAIVQDAAGKGL